MNQKQFLVIIIILISSLTLMTGGLFLVIKYDRTILGLPSEKKDIKGKTNYDPIIQIPQSKLTWLEKSSREIEALKKQKSDLYNVYLKLEDSLKQVRTQLRAYSDSIGSLGKSKNGTVSSSSNLQDSLVRLTLEFLKSQKSLKLAEDKLKAQSKLLSERKDTSSVINYKQFAKIYNNSNPSEVAKILEKINERDAAMILKFMNQKKAGKVIESISPKQAAAILLLGKTN